MVYDIRIEDVEYVRHGDKPLLARLFKPRGSGPFPLVVELHGGAWCRGDRLNDTAINEPLAKSGVVVAALDFRMPPEAPYPASLADINYAIRWLKTRATALGSRPDLVGVLGTSSGAHQAMLGGMSPHDRRYATVPLPAGLPAVVTSAVYDGLPCPSGPSEMSQCQRGRALAGVSLPFGDEPAPRGDTELEHRTATVLQPE